MMLRYLEWSSLNASVMAYLGSGGDEVSFAQGASVEVLSRSTSGLWTVGTHAPTL